MTNQTDRPGFTHLHVHSSYSIGIGLSTPEDLCAHAKRLGYQSLALTDTNGTYGFVELHLGAKKYGLKPIYGSVIYHTSILDPGGERFALTLLAMTRRGLRNVAALTSLSGVAHDTGIAALIDQFRGQTDDVLVLAGSGESEVASRLFKGDVEGAAGVLRRIGDLFEGQVYVEVQDHGQQEEKVLARKLLELAVDSGVQPVFTQEVRYTRPGMRDVYELLSGVHHPSAEVDFFRIDGRGPDRSLRAPSDLEHFRSVYGAAMENTLRIDRLIEDDLLADIDQTSALLERFGDTKRSLRERCTRSFYRRFPSLPNSDIARYQSIVLREVEEIDQAGLVPTMLLYHHIVSRLRKEGVPLGPATGVNLQSLCAYLLDVTSYNPYAYDANFRPMLDPRVDLQSEFEIQFGSESHESVVAELRDMVGETSVAYAPAVERITPARAVRMVEKLIDIEERDLEAVQLIIARNPGVSIKDLAEEDKLLGRVCRRSVPARELIRRAAMLENLPSGFIRSRRSVALSAIPLTDFFAHSVDAATGDLFIHISRDVLPVEPIFRIDLTRLTAVTTAVMVDAEIERQEKISLGWDGFPKSNSAVWHAIQTGETTGIFLFEGQALKQLRELFELRSFDDLTNLLALLRSRGGERTLADRIKAFQRGAIFSGSDPPEIYRILKPTRGHLLYDEQLRDILALLTGANAVEATAMLNDAKLSDPATLSRVRQRFMQGMADRDVPLESATAWFDRVLYYCKYSIRRERVLADAILVYKLSLVRRVYPIIFYSALLNGSVGNESRLKRYIGKLEDQGLLLELDINRSGYHFEPEDGKIRRGFAMVGGLERLAADRLVKARGKRGYRSVKDFLKRTRSTGVTEKDVEHLLEAGAFDSLGESREVVADTLTRSVTKRKKTRAKRQSDQMELPFD